MAQLKKIPDELKKQICLLPEASGVYFFRNTENKTIYIGKARSIKKRVLSHFRNYGDFYSKAGTMLDETNLIDFIHTPTEADALLLEAGLVKEHQPKFNQALKDDKSYPFIKISDEEFPRLLVVRGRKPDGASYFGPYINGTLLREAVRMLRRRFPMRICKNLPGKPCLLYHIKQCYGPCGGPVDRRRYDRTVKELKDFLSGKRDALKKELSQRMKEYSERQEYEKAKIIYEQIQGSVERTAEPPLQT